ncbi:hypothetical protein SAMN06265219_10115 [Gracilimonas mengyeensis]|uniref:Uncharacterized protein n=1 Tax=Gracilimonas mengyeensis TaxID=1302730 RepID=A0A521AAY6_9BACT|nr:hypothetical protein SAMN06265219_10115 [Gracilimonas mengyeensis]
MASSKAFYSKDEGQQLFSNSTEKSKSANIFIKGKAHH